MSSGGEKSAGCVEAAGRGSSQAFPYAFPYTAWAGLQVRCRAGMAATASEKTEAAWGALSATTQPLVNPEVG